MGKLELGHIRLHSVRLKGVDRLNLEAHSLPDVPGYIEAWERTLAGSNQWTSILGRMNSFRVCYGGEMPGRIS